LLAPSGEYFASTFSSTLALSLLFRDPGGFGGEGGHGQRRGQQRSSIIGTLVQLPVFGLLYRAISNASLGAGPFLWMKSLATPNAAVTAIVLVLTALSAYYFPSAGAGPATMMIVVQVLVTAFILWKLSAGVGLYWVASSFVSAVQTCVLRHERRRIAAQPAA
jgi:membrane protein insertase Oxa1/YidC/SpoIIIJ